METLINKEYKDYKKISRYSVFPYYYNRVDNKYIYGVTAHLKKDNTTFVTHKVAQGDTLDTLALHYYNSPTYYWIIADYNDIQDPYEALLEGSTIRIPTFSNVEYNL